MDAWFVRTNGETGHNQPGVKRFIRGEPPNYPAKRFDYRQECLAGGFARVGLPAAGDLRKLEWRSKACEAYGLVPSSHQLTNLERFADIRVGDLVAMPAARETHDVHFGVVVPNQINPAASAGSAPYYYHYNIAAGDGSRMLIACRCNGIERRAAPGAWSAFQNLEGSGA